MPRNPRYEEDEDTDFRHEDTYDSNPAMSSFTPVGHEADGICAGQQSLVSRAVNDSKGSRV
jgi:hypothetical protein